MIVRQHALQLSQPRARIAHQIVLAGEEPEHLAERPRAGDDLARRLPIADRRARAVEGLIQPLVQQRHDGPLGSRFDHVQA